MIEWLSNRPDRYRILFLFWVLNLVIALALLAFALR